MGYDSSLAGIASMVAVLLVLTSGTLILRLVARSKQKASFGIDDILAILAFVSLSLPFGCYPGLPSSLADQCNSVNIPWVKYCGYL